MVSSIMLLYFLLLQHFVIIQILTACPLFLFPRVFVDFSSAFSSVATVRGRPDAGCLLIVPVSLCFRRLYLRIFFRCNNSWSSRYWPLFPFPRVFVDFTSSFSSVATVRGRPDVGRLPIVPVS